jgi:hypothetical protein
MGCLLYPTDLASAALAALGGYIASVNGFKPLIVAVAAIGFIGPCSSSPSSVHKAEARRAKP